MTDSSSKAVLFELKFAVLLNLKETSTPLLGDVLRAFVFRLYLYTLLFEISFSAGSYRSCRLL